jgi:hypothetical protein
MSDAMGVQSLKMQRICEFAAQTKGTLANHFPERLLT